MWNVLLLKEFKKLIKLIKDETHQKWNMTNTRKILITMWQYYPLSHLLDDFHNVLIIVKKWIKNKLIQAICVKIYLVLPSMI